MVGWLDRWLGDWSGSVTRPEQDGVQLEILGSGTSTGVPIIGCDCSVCRSDDPRDQRLRCAALVRGGGTTLVIDTGPDFRLQMLRAAVRRLDAILFTHSHADHVMGLDDVRRFNYLQKEILDCHGLPETLEVIQRGFGYAFSDTVRHGLPGLRAKPFRLGESFTLGALDVTPLPVDHVVVPCAGFIFRRSGSPRRLAYMVDCKRLPPETEAALRGVEVLVLNMLRPQAHPRHFNLEEALATVERLQPGETWFTHISHETRHEVVEADLPKGVRLAYDGLRIGVTKE